MTINGKKVKAKYFAFDGCHKIYLLETDEDMTSASETGYALYPIRGLQKAWNDSCELRFISTWRTHESIVPQFEEASFGK